VTTALNVHFGFMLAIWQKVLCVRRKCERTVATVKSTVFGPCINFLFYSYIYDFRSSFVFLAEMVEIIYSRLNDVFIVLMPIFYYLSYCFYETGEKLIPNHKSSSAKFRRDVVTLALRVMSPSRYSTHVTQFFTISMRVMFDVLMLVMVTVVLMLSICSKSSV